MENDALLRVIHDEPLNGPANMARDEALLTLVGEGLSPPTLRTYQWSPPTISLGYFQRYSEYEALPPPAGRLAVVRRPTGGGAISHDQELTYSLTVPLDHALSATWSAGVNPAARNSRLYELAHDALIECLARHGVDARRGDDSDGSGAAKGPFFCFARRHPLDVVVGTDKLAGSAQRRTRHAVLQHGSIILAVRFPQQPSAAVGDFTTMTLEEFRSYFTDALARRAGLKEVSEPWTAEELALAERLIGKYAGAEWTRQR